MKQRALAFLVLGVARCARCCGMRRRRGRYESQHNDFRGDLSGNGFDSGEWRD